MFPPAETNRSGLLSLFKLEHKALCRREMGLAVHPPLGPRVAGFLRIYFLAMNTGTICIRPLAICSRSALVSGS